MNNDDYDEEDEGFEIENDFEDDFEDVDDNYIEDINDEMDVEGDDVDYDLISNINGKEVDDEQQAGVNGEMKAKATKSFSSYSLYLSKLFIYFLFVFALKKP